MKINSEGSLLWAKSYFGKNKVEETKIVDTSYSTVYKLDVTKKDSDKKEVFYLKTNNEKFNYEAQLINYLTTVKKENQLQIVAQNSQLNTDMSAQNKVSHSFISVDAGKMLFQYFQDKKDKEILKTAMRNYCELQRKVKAEDLKKICIRDFSMDKLYLCLFNALSENNKFSHYINKLSPFEALIENDIRILKNNGLKDSLEHGDFHLGNMLVDDKGKITYIDFAEGTLTNPIFSLISFVLSMSRRLQISPEEILVQQIELEYLMDYSRHIGVPYGTMKYLHEISLKLSDIYFALSLLELLKSDPNNEKWISRINTNLDNIMYTYSS